MSKPPALAMNRISNGSTMPSKAANKAKDWQLEILMEKLRSKASQYKSLPEISKNVRMTLLEKRYALDSVEKSQHQKCLDTLQHSIKVKSLQSMVERLESLTRQLGLKFVVESSGVFISSDMFYLEIVLEASGAVKDVKIHHEGKIEQQSCMELVNCLTRGDFTDFTTQLEGFVSIYQLNAEKKIKCKAFTALESLEADLSTLAQLQLFFKEPFNLLHKSPVGILEKRRGGHPMKLTYFVSPYDLLSVEKAEMEAVNVETIISKNLGYSVTVCMEGSIAHKLQTTTLITVNRTMNGKSTPSYTPLTNQNSAAIPACFILKLNKPMPMCLSLVRQIQQIQPWGEIDSAPVHPLLSLIVTHCSDNKMDSANNKGLFVTLPDQNHCYFMTENKNMDGVLVSSIPFTHPAHVASILKILREQALFNTIIASCVRPNSRQDFENMTMFEISALSSTYVSISLEHPIEESMATAEIDLTDLSSLECRIHNPGTPPPSGVPDVATELSSKILNRSFSIPVTLRSVIKLWEKQASRRNNHYNGHENFSLPLGSGDPGGHKGASTEFGGLDTSAGGGLKVKQEPSAGGGAGGGNTNQLFLNESMMANANFPNFPPSEGVLTNIELTNILSGVGASVEKSGKRLKRKATEELWSKSGKRKVGDDDLLESSSCDSTSRSTPLSSQDTEIPTPNSGLGFQSDLELSGLELIDKSQTGFENMEELGDVEELLSGVSHKRGKNRDKSPTSGSTSSLLSDLGDKGLVSPSVSITPISAGSPGFASGSSTPTNQDKRPGIEIIPLATPSPSSLLPSSITITPIANSGQASTKVPSSEDKSRDKKSSKSRSDDKSRLEKKRKRKRDESPMGPPEKVPPKQDPLTKPVTVSIKPSESPPLPSSTTPTPTSPSMMRKFNASPTQNRSIPNLSGKLSPNLIKSSIKTHSPKHSPAHISSSPKHSIPGISSPKSHGTSPKHPSTSGSGKPSMSTLKNAANSPSNKSGGGGSSSTSSEKSKSSKDPSRDKDKKLSVFNVNKSKSSVKVKPLDLNLGANATITELIPDGLPSPSGLSDPSKANQANLARNRKGSLSAIVDKLKVNAQHCDIATDLTTSKPASKSPGGGTTNASSSNNNNNNNNPLKSDSSSGKTSNKLDGATTTTNTKNSEYMVKPSSDAMKITINKTRTKESKSVSKSSSGSGSPKTHTGLKPGVNSGPASKKPQVQQQKTGLSNSSGSGGGNGGATAGFASLKSSAGKSPSSSSSGGGSGGGGSGAGNKITSSGSTLSKSSIKLSGSPKTGSTATDLSRSSKSIKSSKSSSEKSIFSMKDNRKGSPTPHRDDSSSSAPTDIFKLSKDPYASALVMKQLDKNFQIPKLSARSATTNSTTQSTSSSEEKKPPISNTSSGTTTSQSPGKLELNNINRSTVDTKMFDMIAKSNDLHLPKYPLAVPPSNKMFDAVDGKIRNSINISPLVSPKLKDDDVVFVDEKKKELIQNLTNPQGKDDLFKLDPISASKTTFPTSTSSLSASSDTTKSLDLATSKFIAPAPRDDKKDKKTEPPSDILLDFSSTKSDLATKSGNSTLITSFPQSPSVSVHIVKSPAPSPMINPSPHSASPCITDDELMDEALVGLGK